MSDRNRKGDLSNPLKRLLSELHFHGYAVHHATKWIIPNTGAGFQQCTIDAAYDRYLVKIIYDSRHKRHQSVELTEMGQLAASGVVVRALKERPPQKVSEQAALLIQEIIA